MKIVRPVVQTVGSISGTVRDANRFREVAVILARHGFGALVSGLDIPGVDTSSNIQSTPERLVQAIQALGPTFIKFGQILSTRPDIITEEYLQALQTLQDDVESIAFKSLESTLMEDFGHDWKEQLLSIDEIPLATASIAQVHQAVLKDGRKVVFKIRRPGISEKIMSDLNILRFLLDRGLHEFPEFELFDPRGMFLEFKEALIAELDLALECRNLQRFRKNFFHVEGIVFPEPVEEFCTKRILCMDFMEGTPIRKARENGFDMKIVGDRYLNLAYTMLFDHGIFHGDLHPGNVLVMPENRIAVLDCGMVGRLTQDMKDQLATLIFALYRGDNKLIAKTFFDISIKSERIDYAAFERDAIAVADRHWSGGSFAEMDIGSFLMDLTSKALRHKVHAPPAFTMFFKGVLTTEGLAKSLLPEMDPLQVAQPYVEKLLRARWQPENWSDIGAQNMMAYAGLLKRLPISLSQMLDDIDYQRLTLTVQQHQSHTDHKEALKRQAYLVASIFAGLWMALAIAGLFVESLYWNGIPVFFLVALCVSLLIQILLLIRLWWSL